MARIREYQNDDNLEVTDKLIGTDSNGNPTRNFTLEDLKEFINSGVNILVPAPDGYFPITNQNEDDATISTVRQTYDLQMDIHFYPAGITPAADDTGQSINVHERDGKSTDFRISVDGSGRYFEIVDYQEKFHQPSFIGKTIRGTWGTDSNPLDFVVGEINTTNNPDNKEYRNDNGEIIWRYEIDRYLDSNQLDLIDGQSESFTKLSILTGDDDNGATTLQQVTVNFYAPIEATELTIDKIEFPDAGDGVYWGTEDGTHTSALTISDSNNNKSLMLTGAVTGGGGIWNLNNVLNVLQDAFLLQNATVTNDLTVVLGDIEASAGDIVSYGSNNIIAANRKNPSVTENNSSVSIGEDSIVRNHYLPNDTHEITYVLANQQSGRSTEGGTRNPDNQGILTSIQIGDDFYTIPTAVTNVASVLPGLTEDLEGTPHQITTGTWFYGFDRGNYAEYVSAAPTITSFTIDGDVTFTQVPDTGSPTIANQVNSAFQAIEPGQRLFFLAGTGGLPAGVTGPSDGNPGTSILLNDSNPDGVYEVVSFTLDSDDDALDRRLVFHNLQGGGLTISSPSVTFQNVPTADDNASGYLIIDSDGVLHQRDLHAGAEIQAAFVSDTVGVESNHRLRNLTFVGGGPTDINVSDVGSNVEVDVSGRLTFESSEQLDDISAATWTAYVLGNTDSDESRTITLPETNLVSGDIIRIINLADIDSNGDPQSYTNKWSIDAGSNRIMKSTEDLELDDATQFELIWTGITSVGWIIK